MKNLIHILLLAYFSLNTFSSFSQGEHETWYDGIRIFDYEYGTAPVDSVMHANKIASSQATEFESKKAGTKIKSTIIKKFDADGREAGYEYYGPKGELWYADYYEYDREGHKTAALEKRHNLHFKTVYELGELKRPVKIITYFGKSFDEMRITSYTENIYNSDSNKISSITYDKKHILMAKVDYNYDAGKKIGQAKMYDKKGKLVHSWNFTCDTKGAIDKKGKEEKICKSRAELANGHIQEITIDNDKSNINRFIYEYDPKGLFSMTEKYTGKLGTVLEYRTVSKKSNDTSYSSSDFYFASEKHNTIRFKVENTGFLSKRISAHYESYFKKNKLYNSVTSEFEYNSSGLIVKESRKDHLKKKMNTVVYMYLVR
jgi:hypothetical protein